MRTRLVLLSSLLLFGTAVFSQSASPALQLGSQPQADILMAQAVAAFSASPVTSVHLIGTAHAIAGSTDQSGTFTFDLKRDGESNLHVDAGTLTRTETTGSSLGAPACTWSGADGVQHGSSQHNCLLPVNCVLPVLALQSMGSRLSRSLSGGTDLTLSHPPFDSSAAGVRFAEFSSSKLSLDQSTFLPTSLSFNIHPDNDERINIPIVLRYADFRQVSGASIPFHIEKYLNNALILDLRVENVSVQ